MISSEDWEDQGVVESIGDKEHKARDDWMLKEPFHEGVLVDGGVWLRVGEK